MIRHLVAAAALAVGVTVGLSSPASAHPGPPGWVLHHSDLSYWTCGASKGPVITTIDYDWPYYMSPEVVGYTCNGHWHNPNPDSGTFCAWEAQLWWNGIVTSGTKSCSGF